MSILLDTLYVPRLKTRLKMFKRKNDYTWNFRCPICGDSHKNDYKARGYILRKKDSLYFFCHNCGTSMSFSKFLKNMDPILYREYQLESLDKQKSKSVNIEEYKTETHFDSNIKIELPTIEELDSDHLAKKFCLNRQIPQKFFNDLYYAQDYKKFVNEINPEYSKDLYSDEKRLVIPFRSENNILQGFQGRAISKSNLKYITIMLDNDSSKIYGLERLDPTKTVYVVEGPIDSMFLDNCIASTDAQLYNVPFRIRRSTNLDIEDTEFVFIYDNEPRNKAITKNIKRTIDLGYNVFLWPDEFSNIKDINEAIESGYTQSLLQHWIDHHNYNDLKAKLEYIEWVK